MEPAEQTDLIWAARMVGRPRGTHFSDRTPSPLVFADGTNALSTHAVLGPEVEPNDDRSSEQIERIAFAAAAGAIIGAAAATVIPRVRNWWRTRMSSENPSLIADAAVSPGSTSVVEPEAIDRFCTEVDLALANFNGNPANRRRIVAVLIAAALIAENSRALAASGVELDLVKLQAAMDKLTAPEILEQVNKLFGGQAPSLDEASASELFGLFVPSDQAGGQRVELRSERIAEVLCLPGSMESR